MKKLLPFPLLINSVAFGSDAEDPPPLVLHYGQPARAWAAEALPVGNGRMGAMVFGGVETERLQLNEESIWAGPPVPKLTAGFKDAFQRARGLWFESKHTEAQALVQENMPERISPRSHQTLGDLKIVMLDGGNAPVITCPSGQKPFREKESVGHSVDGNPATKWCVQHGDRPVVWQIDLPQPVAVPSYSFTAGNDVPERDPRTWVLEGSEDGTDWISLHERKGQDPMKRRGSSKRFRIRDPERFSHYRIRFEPNSGVKHFQLAEIALDGVVTGSSIPEDYRRELDLDRAVATTTFTLDGVKHRREVFASASADVLVTRWTADRPGAINALVSISRPADASTEALDEATLAMHGRAGHNGKHPGVRFHAVLKAATESGTVKSTDDGSLEVNGADSLTLILGAQTDYNRSNPSEPLKVNLPSTALNSVTTAAGREYGELLDEHITDHQRLFRRCSLDLGGWEAAGQPTDERMARVKKSYDKEKVPACNDPALFALYFQFGRYLLISSSRPDDLAANLQGIWNDRINAPWNADYHININIQMNYWPAEVTNLSECHEPFFKLIEGLVPAGRGIARDGYGARGFAAHHTTDAWLHAAPFGKVQYGMWPHGAGWSVQHFMERYRFTNDTAFLRERAWPILLEAALFYLDYLEEDPETGRLVCGLDTSPENRFRIPGSRKILQISMGASMSQQIAWDVFTNTIETAGILGIDDPIVAEIKDARERLAETRIGEDGRLMEWARPFEEAAPGHRHISHLFAIHPGRQYTVQGNPKMIEAGRKTIDYRLSHGGGHTGWSRAWIINFRARFRQPEEAWYNLHALLAKSTTPNLFDTHPPFQIDGNFGGTAGIAEMLLQSHAGDSTEGYLVELLPALPACWANGSVRGLRARGGFTVDMRWAGGVLAEYRITHPEKAKARVSSGDRLFTTPGDGVWRKP